MSPNAASLTAPARSAGPAVDVSGAALVLHAIADAVVLVDRDGHVTYANAAAARLTPDADFHFPATDVPRVRAAVGEALAGRAPGELEVDHPSPAGDRHTIAWSLARVPSADGDGDAFPGHVVATGRDVTRRCRVLADAAEADRTLRSTLDAIPQFVWTMLPDGRVDYVNAYFLREAHATLEEVQNGVFLTRMHPGDHAANEAAWQRVAQTGGPFEVEYRFRPDPAGGYHWYSTRCDAVRDDAGQIVRWVGSSMDVTERKRAADELRGFNETLERRVAERTAAAELRSLELATSEEALQYEKRVLRMILEAVADGVAVADESGRLTLFTPAAERICGTGVWDGPTGAWPDHYGLFLPDGTARFPADRLPMVRAIGGEPSDDVEMLIRHPGCPDGRSVLVTGRPLRDELGRPRGGVVALRDVTGRKRAQRELQFRQSLLEALNDASDQGILVVDTAGRVLLTNRRFADMWGMGAADLASRRDGEVVDMALAQIVDPAAFLARIAYLYEHPDERSRDELRLKNGRTFDRFSAPIRGADGTPYGRVWFFHDVTDLKDAEESARASADHNRRLALEIDHRVGNNLAALLALVQMTRDRTGDVGAFATAMEGRLRAMAHVHHLLREARWQRVDLRDLVLSTRASMTHLALAAAEATVDGPPVWIAPGRVPALAMVLVEWFTNSSKYGAHSKAGGRLRVEWTVVAVPDGAAGTGTGTGGPRVRLTWTERGGPAVHGPVQPSLGTALVEAFVTRELGGTCALRYPPEGAEYAIEFPAGE